MEGKWRVGGVIEGWIDRRIGGSTAGGMNGGRAILEYTEIPSLRSDYDNPLFVVH
jgi:hypothetical protein